MNERDESSPRDALTDAWRRASDAAGDAPPASVRAAILAQARAQLQASAEARPVASVTPMPMRAPSTQSASQPTSTQPTHWRAASRWRLAATLAGVGFAGVLALIVLRQRPEPLPAPTAMTVSAPAPEISQDAVQPPAPAPTRAKEAVTDNAQREAAVAGASAVESRVAAPDVAQDVAPAAPAPLVAPDAAPAVAAASPPASPAPPTALAEQSASNALANDARSLRRSAQASQPMLTLDRSSAGIAPAPAPAASAFEQYFPGVASSGEAADWQYWVVLDATGQLLRRGRRRADAVPPIETWLMDSVPEARGATWRREDVARPRGAALALWVAQRSGNTAIAP